MLVEELRPARDLSRTPFFQVSFQVKPSAARLLTLKGLTVSDYDLPWTTAQFDLSLDVNESADGLTCVWEYNSDLFDGETIHRMASHFETLLHAIVAQPDAQVSALPLLTAGERQQLLVAWNGTHADWSHDLCAHQLFEAHAVRTPTAVAVGCNGKRLTYRELNTRAWCRAGDARRVHARRRARGVGRDAATIRCGLVRRREDAVPRRGLGKRPHPQPPLPKR